VQSSKHRDWIGSPNIKQIRHTVKEFFAAQTYTDKSKKKTSRADTNESVGAAGQKKSATSTPVHSLHHLGVRVSIRMLQLTGSNQTRLLHDSATRTRRPQSVRRDTTTERSFDPVATAPRSSCKVYTPSWCKAVSRNTCRSAGHGASGVQRQCQD
jgi:hypothetical protein